MSEFVKVSSPSRTASGLTLIVTTAGFMAFANTGMTEIDINFSTPAATASSLLFSVNKGVNEPLEHLERNINQLWDSLEIGSFVPTDKELEMAGLFLENFPNNTM